MNSHLLCFTVLFALVACVYTRQFCFRTDHCGDGRCCRRSFRFLPGICSNKMLGSFCGGRFDCECLEGECRRGRCRRTNNSTAGSTEGTASTSALTEPTTLPSTMEPETTQVTETTAP